VQNTEKSRVRHNSPCSATILGQSNVEDFHGEGSGLTHAAAGTADGKEEICRIREAASLQAQRAGAPSRRVRVKAVTNTRTRGCEGQTFSAPAYEQGVGARAKSLQTPVARAS